MKKAIIIPGWTPEYNDTPYAKIADYFTKSSFQPSIYLPDWSQHSMEAWIKSFVEEAGSETEPLTILGFSMGGMLALAASPNLNVKTLILCSPSGYFKEYIPLLTNDDLQWAEENIKDFKLFSAKETVQNLHIQDGHILAGEKELNDWADFKKWVSDLQEDTSWTMQTIPNTGHEIEADEYQSVVANLISSLV